METIVDETDTEALELIIRSCGIVSMCPTDRIIGFRDAKGIRGAFLIERYTGEGGTCHIHWAGRDKYWLKQYMLILVAIYVFDQLQCTKVYGQVRAKDTSVRAIDEKLGFKQVCVLENYFPNDDLVIYEATKEECDWLPDDFKEKSNG